MHINNPFLEPDMKKSLLCSVCACFVLCSSLAFTAQAPAYSAEDIDRWLGEYIEIIHNLENVDTKTALCAKAYEAGNIFASLWFENRAKGQRGQRGQKKNEEAKRWAQISQNNNVAAVLHERAASDSRAQTLLGVLNHSGLGGIPQDEGKAVEWYRKAAEQGDVQAQTRLGYMYGEGRGVAKDEAKAVELYRKAAEQGNAQAQTGLGVMYAYGRGIPKDEGKAAEWYRKAAEQGHAQAQTRLGYMYGEGRGVAKDEAKAVEWYRKAAEQGDAHAQTHLGVMYEKGRGVTKDETKAVEWYRKAAEQGNANAQKYLDELEGRLHGANAHQ
jgi:TPR repeat protein